MRPLTRCYTALIALALMLGSAYSSADPYCTAESNPEHCATLENQMRYLYYPRADNNFGRVDNLLALFYHRQLVAQGKAVERRADMSLGDPEQDYQRGLLFLSLSPEDRAAVLSADDVAVTLDRLVTPQAKATVAAEAAFFRSLPSDAVRTNYMTMTPHDRLAAATTMPRAEALAFIEAQQGAFSYSPWDINLDDIHEHLALLVREMGA